MSRWTEPSKKSIKETIIEASKMIQRRGGPVTGFISVAVSEDARKLFESWGYVEVSLPLTLVYGILFLIQWAILATLLVPVLIGEAIKTLTIWIHRVGGPRIKAGENLFNPVARFNHFVFKQEIKL